MSLLSAHDIEKSYGAHQVLRGVSVTLASRDRVGLVGNNGSGKTTLARVLGKLEPPDVGTVMQQRNSCVGYLAQVPVIDENATVREAALQGLAELARVRGEHEALSRSLAADSSSEDARRAMIERLAELDAAIERLGGWSQEHRAAAILERLHVANLDARVGTLSGGERRRVALCALLVSEPDVLILDEPTNHLDTDSIDWLEEYLEDAYPGAVLVITHDRYFLDRVVRRTWELDRGQVQSYEGGWEAYLAAKAERQALEARTEANRQNFLRTELEWLRRQPKARGTKQKARIQRAGAALVEGPKAARGLAFEATSQRQGSEVLELSKLRAGYGERVLIDGLELIVTPGQRIGIIGPNGAGKTTLLELVSQRQAPVSGSVRLGKNTRIGYFAQTRRELDDNATVAENVAGLRQTVSVGGREITIYSYLERFMFRGEEIRKKVGVLSGGERARVALAKLLLVPCNLLLLDEPTNDLDITALGALEQMLCEFAGSVMVVTHDRYFLDRVATSLLVFEGAGRVAHYVGDYANYASLRAERSRLAPGGDAAAEKRAVRAEKTTEARPAKLSYKEQKELAEIEAVIEAAEGDVSRLTKTLADPELYRTDAARAGALGVELEAAQARVQTLMDRWQELESKREAAAKA